MIDPARILERLTELGVDLYTGVPDSLLKEFGRHVVAAVPRGRHIIAANEGASVGIALGHYLRTGRPALVYLQNSGFGNAVNPLLSLADREVYGIPMLLLIGWRGQPGVKDEPQHVKQGRVMTAMLDAMELPWGVLPTDPDEADRLLTSAVERAEADQTPFAILVEKDAFSPSAAPTSQPDTPDLSSREEALQRLAEAVGDDAIVVSTTGMLSRELFEHRETTGRSGARDFLTVGGMGHASAIALGIAKREPEREVWCFDGDGALLMHLGGLAVIADHAPRNYLHVVFNNGVHDSVGGQPTSIGVVDIPAIARAAGYRSAARLSDLADLPAAVADMRGSGGPALLELRVRPGNRPGIGRPTRTPAESKRTFMDAIR